MLEKNDFIILIFFSKMFFNICLSHSPITTPLKVSTLNWVHHKLWYIKTLYISYFGVTLFYIKAKLCHKIINYRDVFGLHWFADFIWHYEIRCFPNSKFIRNIANCIGRKNTVLDRAGKIVQKSTVQKMFRK